MIDPACLVVLVSSGFEVTAPGQRASIRQREGYFIVDRQIVSGNHSGNRMLIGRFDDAQDAVEAFLLELSDVEPEAPPTGAPTKT